MAQDLAKDQWKLVGPAEYADLYVINSCTVTAEADRQTRQAVRRALRQNPLAQVVVTGCYAQNEAEECAAIPGVSLVLGNDQKRAVAKFARTLKRPDEPGRVPVHIDRLTSLPAALLNGFDSRSRAFLQVQQGCDQSCTFCVIHRARGPSRSFAEAHVLRQIQTFVDSGYREVVICGVDLGSYTTGEVSDEVDLPLTSLLRKIADLPGSFRVRLSSIDPVHLTDDLLDLLSDGSRFCPYLHVSMQSGSTLILKRMKRRYGRESLIDRLSAARQRIGGLVLGADVMTGFPTESERDFTDSLEVIKSAQIIYPHVFCFSGRPGTPAARIPRQIERVERRRRASILRDAGQTLRCEALNRMVGQHGSLIMERPDAAEKPGAYHGRLANYMPVRLEDPENACLTEICVQIQGVDSDVLVARVSPSE
tara:strand:- start:19144 stop:20409 length:1266 start_codon:yes stop_codon:yes gene_type:complete